MPTYRAPVKDMLYVLNDILHIEKYSNLPTFENATPDLIAAILEEGSKLCEEVIQPLNQIGDKEGCTRHDDGSVTTPAGFKEAYKLFTEGGWQGLNHTPEYGGQGLPYFMGVAMEEMLVSANLAFAMYPGLTSGTIAILTMQGSDEEKAKWLPNLIAGKWAGTMNLTEPHCGTDLGMLRTKAVPQDDGSYKITGTKIFISSGEHDLTENIIHFVLARTPDAPAGVKGISLFVVPKVLVNDDGSLGARNGVTCGSLEEKMGIHGNATAVLNYEDATGYLFGEEHKGLRGMFVMMNAARLGVAVQGLALSEVATQNAADYARERLQGRSISGVKEADKPADPIIVHPDVRRMLMDARAFNEGARAFALWVGLMVDISRKSPDEDARKHADNLLNLLTPVLKGYLTDGGYRHATAAQQVFGGAGYIVETGMEQFVRDARICQIYEGTNGIQALDLVGRKLPMEGGLPIRTYLELMEHFFSENADESYAEFIDPLKTAVGDLQKAVLWFAQNGPSNPDNAGAGSVAFLYLLGTVALGHMWAKMAITSAKILDAGAEDKDFHHNKLITARYFIHRNLPDTAMYLRKIEAGAEDVMALDAADF